jgi:hypothetical protein
MEYENCPQDNAVLSSNMMMYAVVAIFVLLVFYYASQPKQHAVGVRDGNWVNGIYVSNRPRK